MFSVNSEMNAGAVRVFSTENRSLSPEEWAELAADKIMAIGDQAPQPIRDQAHAFKDRIRHVVAYYVRQAVESNEKQLIGRLK